MKTFRTRKEGGGKPVGLVLREGGGTLEREKDKGGKQGDSPSEEKEERQ